ncbi:hypothetical protein RZS08_12010, partial [Arthrospira platensis SPKY1]|nr:hypothetical protein [Arthrospira platensis SPKY1]
MFALVLVVVLASCSADNPDSGVTTLRLDIEPTFGTTALQVGTPIQWGEKRISINQARFYVSQVVLLAEDGSEVPIVSPSLSFPARQGEQDVVHAVEEYVGYLR